MTDDYTRARKGAYDFTLRLLVASQPSNPKALKPVIRQAFESVCNPERDEDADAGICAGIHLAVHAFVTDNMHHPIDTVALIAAGFTAKHATLNA